MNPADLLEGFRIALEGDRPRLLLAAALMTVGVSLASLFVGLAVGVPVGIVRVRRTPVLYPLSSLYVEVVRGTPLIVQISVVYFGLPALGLTLPAFPAATLALGLHSGAYVAEIVRGGVQGVDRGQLEAARSLGLSWGQAMRLVVLPQALFTILPALGNEFISLVLGSSLASAVTLVELFQQGRLIIGATYRQFEVYAVVALVYLALTFTLSRLVARLEARLGRGRSREAARRVL